MVSKVRALSLQLRAGDKMCTGANGFGRSMGAGGFRCGSGWVPVRVRRASGNDRYIIKTKSATDGRRYYLFLTGKNYTRRERPCMYAYSIIVLCSNCRIRRYCRVIRV